MKAMVLENPGQALRLRNLPIPEPGEGEALLRVEACGVCRTDLHILDGELDEPCLPLVPGHQIVARVESCPDGSLQTGSRVGIPWLGGTCGRCEFCRSGKENLCRAAEFTGYSRNGGFAEYCTARTEFCFPLPEDRPALQLAPLLCAGLIGFRAWRFCGEHCRHLGLYGFGAAAHILAQVAASAGQSVYAFTRPDDTGGQAFARSLGVTWAGGSDEAPPEPLDAAIIFAPVGPLVPEALSHLKPAGRLVLGGIHMSDIPALPYRLLWEERRIQSVANLTRRDGTDFFAHVHRHPVTTEVTGYALEAANEALEDLRTGRLTGAAVLDISGND